MNRAYSLLDVKEIVEREDEFVIRGIASTPTPDRMQDVVEPMGARFKTPMPLLWQHKSDKPVGLVTFAKPTKNGIPFEATLPNVKEAGTLKDRIDEAIQSIKYRLVAAVSIGFQPVADAVESIKNGGYRFMEWEWLELSLVTIPANSEATITSFKSLDQEYLRAASGENANVIDVTRLASNRPGVSGKTLAPIPRGNIMRQTISEQIAGFEAKRAACASRREEIQQKALDEGRNKNEVEKEEFSNLSAEIKSIDDELVDLRLMQQENVAKATVITQQDGQDPDKSKDKRDVKSNGYITVKSNLEPGIRFARYAQALVRGKFNPQSVLQEIQADPVWMRSTPELAMIAKTAIPAADSTTSGWASELAYAQNMADEFIEHLRPMTIIGRIQGFSRAPFNVRVGGLSSGTTGYWVGQGLPIPVSKGVSTSATLGITKAAGIAAITKELARLSTPSAEAMIRDDLARAVVQTIDDAFINPNNGGIANEKPASIIYGVTPVTPTGTTYALFRADIQTLMETSFDNNLDTEGSVWIMSKSSALKFSMMVNALDQRVHPGMTPNGGEFLGYPVVVSQQMQIAGSPSYGDIIIFLHPREVLLADDGQVTLESSDQVSLQLLDNPTNQSTGSTAPTTVVSMFQTESIAIKAVRYINWAKKRSTAAQWITMANYVG
jgi:HK97 family phage major capsid protein/HK97 family phage prohead protease